MRVYSPKKTKNKHKDAFSAISWETYKNSAQMTSGYNT